MNNPAGISATTVRTRLGPLHVQTARSGPPAVLWHSLSADSTTWIRVREPLASVRRLVLIDGPAHGPNPPVPRRFALGDCAGAAADVLDHLHIGEPVDWLGNAWGGHVGIVFAAAHPGRCRTLAAIGAPVHALTGPERQETAFLASAYRICGPGAPLVNPLVDALLGPQARTGDPEGAAIVADASRRASRRGMHTAIRSASLARPDLTPVLDTTGNARAAASRLTHGGPGHHPRRRSHRALLQAPPTSPDWSPASGATQPPN